MTGATGLLGLHALVSPTSLKEAIISDLNYPPLVNSSAGTWDEWYGRDLMSAESIEREPQRTALLVIDMQNDFCSSEGIMASLGADLSTTRDVVALLPALVVKARESGVLVVYLNNINLPHSFSSSDPEVARRVQRGTPPDITLRGTWGARQIEELAVDSRDILVVKHRRSGFINTDLEAILRTNGRDILCITGVVSSACVLATAIDAAQRDFYSFVIEDGIAAYETRMHDAAMTVIRSQVNGVLDCHTMLRAWSPPVGVIVQQYQSGPLSMAAGPSGKNPPRTF